MNRYLYMSTVLNVLDPIGPRQTWKANDQTKYADVFLIKKQSMNEIRAGEWYCSVKNCGDDGWTEGYVSEEQIFKTHTRTK